MTSEILKYLLVTIFILMTYWLSYKGMKKTSDLKSFSIGKGDMSPYVIGLTLSASISSTATFVINPGFVYTHGLSAYLHYGVAAFLGITLAFVILTKGFRKIGSGQGSLTIPDWIAGRYKSKKLGLFFAILNLLSITFVVLIMVGCSLLLANLFPVSQKMALIIILLFVFSYVLMGGSYAHAYTNTLQGVVMLGISLFIFFHGLPLFEGGFFESLTAVSPEYGAVYNSNSSLYYDFFSVFGSSFVITFALMLQPHILTKILFLKDDKQVGKFLGTTIITGGVFGLMLFVGFYAKLKGLEVMRQDAVVIQYIASALGPLFLTFVSIGLLAAGLSTLDGILVALSSMVVNDIYNPWFADKSGKSRGMSSLLLSRIVLVVIGLVSLLLAWNPPKLVGLFAQKGVYGLAAASFVPILFGVLSKKRLSAHVIFISSFSALITHLGLNIFGGILNPAVSATCGIGLSTLIAILALSVGKVENKETALDSI